MNDQQDQQQSEQQAVQPPQPQPTPQPELSPTEMQGMANIALMIYILYTVALFIGITSIIGVIMAHVKCADAAGTWLESHFRWQIRTFWWGLLWSIIGVVTVLAAGIGFLVLIVAAIWIIYRIVRGWMLWAEKKPAPIA